MTQRTIFCTTDQHARMRHIAVALRSSIEADVDPDQILVLAAHQPAAAAMHEALHRESGHPIRLATVRQSALSLLRRFPAAAHLPAGWNETLLMSGIERHMLIRQAWASVGSDRPSLWNERGAAPGALDWVARLFDRWSSWAATADPQCLASITPTHAHVAELWQAYGEYLRLCHAHSVLAFSDVFGRALDLIGALGDDRSALQVLLLGDLDLFEPAEWLFAGLLITSETQVIASCADAPSATSAIDRVRSLARWVAAMRFQVIHIDREASALDQISVEYPSPEAEAEAIARRIAAEGAGRWSEYAIVPFDRESVALLQRTLPRFDVPIAGQDARDGYRIALTPLAHVGLKLLAKTSLTTLEARSFARHPALGLHPADAHVISEACARGWLFDGPAPTGLSSAALDLIEQVQQALEAVRTLDLPTSAKLQHWLQALDLPHRCWQHTAAVLPEWAVALDQEHWQRIWNVLQRSEQLSVRLGSPLTPIDAIEVLQGAQALIVPRGAPADNAVQLWQSHELSGFTARHVFLAGLHEGALPQPLEPLPFADDLLGAFAVLPGFVAPQTNDRAAAWERAQRDLRRAFGCATASVQLSYSRTDRQGRRQLPSPLLENVSNQPSAISRQQSAVSDQLSVATNQQSRNIPQSQIQNVQRARESKIQVSQSALEDYFVCPRRAFFARQLKLYDVAAAPRQALGQVVHRALSDLIQRGATELDEAAARDLVAQRWVDDVQVWGSRLKWAVFRQLAEHAVIDQARYEAEGSGTVTLGVEARFQWEVPDDNAVITGQIDRIDRDADGLHIIDYKLGQNSPSLGMLLKEFVPPADGAPWRPGDVQLPIYALAAEHGQLEGIERLPGERVASVALVYPLLLYNDNGRRSATGVRRITIVDHTGDCPPCTGQRPAKQAYLCREQLANVLDDVRVAIDQMRANHWPPEPREGSRTCASCPFRSICPAPQ